MDDLFLKFVFLVALVTECAACGFQQIVFPGGVRVVAVDAFAFFQGRVHHGFFHSDFGLVMAGIAGLIARSFQEQLRDDTVPQVAVLTFFFLDDGMHIFERQVFFRKVGMTLQARLGCKFARLARRRRRAGNHVNNTA